MAGPSACRGPRRRRRGRFPRLAECQIPTMPRLSRRWTGCGAMSAGWAISNCPHRSAAGVARVPIAAPALASRRAAAGRGRASGRRPAAAPCSGARPAPRSMRPMSASRSMWRWMTAASCSWTPRPALRCLSAKPPAPWTCNMAGPISASCRTRTRPFIVEAAERKIVATRCNFDVRCEDGKVQVVLIHGEADVKPASAADRAGRDGLRSRRKAGRLQRYRKARQARPDPCPGLADRL